MKNEFDFIIIGQGLAGSLLAHFMQAQHGRVLVIDPGHPVSSSRIAAGIIHPLSGRRIVKTWMAGELIPFAENTYRELGHQLGRSFYFQKSIFEIYPSVGHRNDWQARSADPGMEAYLGTELAPDALPGVHSPLGAMEVKGGGYLLIRELLSAIRDDLERNNRLLGRMVRYNDIRVAPDCIHVGDLKASHLIFCEGASARNNPWFGYLPFVPAKGEILTLSAVGLTGSFILNKGLYVLPLGNGLFRAGATHEWDQLDEIPTREAKEKMVRLLKTMIDVPFEILSHEAAVRPTVKDRRPFLGTHPDHPRLHIFNGLGTRGVMLAPWFANLFCRYLSGKAVIPAEVDCNRFPG